MPPVFPADFTELLTPAGARRLRRLAGALAADTTPFLSARGGFDPGLVRRGLAALERDLRPLLRPIDVPVPPETIWNQTRSFQERLPKAARLATAYLERRADPAFRAAEALGILAMLRSSSLRRVAEALVGRRLKPRPGCQVLCYGAGDYMGPHHDHHPDIDDARDGYLDLHLVFSTPAAGRQMLIHARNGHLTETVELVGPGSLNAYRLPFWHQVTPLQPRRGADPAAARRWVLLASFRFA